MQLFNVKKILLTEEHDAQYAQQLGNKILKKGFWTKPVWVEKSSFALMDGHHRVAAAKALGLGCIPVILLDYNQVNLTSRRQEFSVTPEKIIERARSRKLFPQKTTCHKLLIDEPQCKFLLEQLRTEDGFEKHMSWVWSREHSKDLHLIRERYNIAS